MGQLRMRVNVLLNVFNCYGQEDIVRGVSEAFLALADIYAAREAGEDLPYPDVGKGVNGLGREC